MLLRNLICLLSLAGTALCQQLLVDRSPSAPGGSGAIFVGLHDQDHAYITDTFQVGKTGEVWFIDHIRLWGKVEPDSGADFGSAFESLALYGGLAPSENSNGNAECACHGPTRLKTAEFKEHSDVGSNPDVVITRQRTGLSDAVPGTGWQIDLQNVRWSVPGGMDIQFGLLAEGRIMPGQQSKFVWSNEASASVTARPLLVYSETGKQLRAYTEGRPAHFYIQVWGHPSTP